MADVGAVRIGTSGWSYPSGPGSWNGIVYPKPRPRGFDELAYYATLFDTVEINTSFYGVPSVETVRNWIARTPAGFTFSLKLYQKFTHPKMMKAAALTRAPGNDGPLLDALVAVTPSDVDDFRRVLDLLADAGKLGALLAQFPPSFKADEGSRAYLERLLRAFAAYEVAVELRHRTWSDDLGATLALLNAFDAALVQIDEPKFSTSIRQNLLPNVSFYYLRLHGRNAKQWWHPTHRDLRYDYLYSPDELQPFADAADAVRRLVKRSYLYLNNHAEGKSAVNALQLQKMLSLRQRGDHRRLVEHYPELASSVPTIAPPTPKP